MQMMRSYCTDAERRNNGDEGIRREIKRMRIANASSEDKAGVRVKTLTEGDIS